MLVDWIAAGFTEALFWDSTPRQIARHFDAVRKRMRREANARMEQAYVTAMLPNMKNPPKLAELLIDVDAAPRRKQGWQEIKAALQLALGTKEAGDGGQ